MNFLSFRGTFMALPETKKGPDIVNILKPSDICFLYESWCDSNSNINLNGYISHNFYRTFQHRRARRNSGGIVLYYKEQLKDGIQIIKNHFDTIIWLKLDHLFFNTQNDIYVCGAYIWGEDSPMYNSINVDLFDILENDLFLFDSLGSVFICGDLNSRVGQKSDYIIFDKLNDCCDCPDYVFDSTPARASNDRSHNNHGIKL